MQSMPLHFLCEAKSQKTKEFQMHLLHYFPQSDNKSNHHHLTGAKGQGALMLLRGWQRGVVHDCSYDGDLCLIDSICRCNITQAVPERLSHVVATD